MLSGGAFPPLASRCEARWKWGGGPNIHEAVGVNQLPLLCPAADYDLAPQC